MSPASRIIVCSAAFIPIFGGVGCSKNWKDKGGDPVTAGTDSGATDTDTTTDSGGDSATGDSATTGDTGDSTVPPTDADGDGHSPTADGGDDCDDTDPTVYTGAPELCDGKDTNCDGVGDGDQDGDGIPDCSDYCPIYASPAGTGDGRYADPVGSLQDAIDLAGASGCDEARAYYGTYLENVNFDGWPVNLESVSGVGVTTVDGGGAASVFTFSSGETADARIYGFTITDGGGADGAGLSIHDSDPTIEGNLITANVASASTWLGGGIRIYNGSPTILDNTISDNDAGYGGPEDGCDGGGLDIRGGSPSIDGNYIVDNTAGDGGGLWLAYSDAIITNNWISGNEASDSDATQGGQGGGLDIQIGGSVETLVIANVISDNVAGMFGGGLVTYEESSSSGEARIENNTIVYNDVTLDSYGAGICQWGRTKPTFVNNIIAGNHGVGAYSADGIDSTFTYNDVYGNDTNYSGLTGASNVTGSPRFVGASDDGDWTNDDFTLGSGSAAKNTGDPSILNTDGTRSDIGAYGGTSGGWVP